MACCEQKNTNNCTECPSKEEDPEPEPKLYPNIEILLGVVLLCILIAAIIGNFLTFIVVTKMKSWKNSAIMFIIHLAILDITMSMSTTPLSIYALFTGRKEVRMESKELKGLCNFLGFSWILVRALVPLTNLSIAIDRAVAIKKPLQYSKIMNWKCVVLYLLIWWIVALHFSFTPIVLQQIAINSSRTSLDLVNASSFAYNDYTATCYPFLARDVYYEAFQSTMMVVTVIIPFILIFTLSLVVIISIRRREAASSAVSTNTDNKRVTLSKMKTRRATTTLVIVSSVFLFCWLPYAILVIVSELTEVFVNNPTEQTYLVLVASMLITFNSATNPLIFIVRSEKYRQTVLESFGRFKAKMETYKPEENKMYRKIEYINMLA